MAVNGQVQAPAALLPRTEPWYLLVRKPGGPRPGTDPRYRTHRAVRLPVFRAGHNYIIRKTPEVFLSEWIRNMRYGENWQRPYAAAVFTALEIRDVHTYVTAYVTEMHDLFKADLQSPVLPTERPVWRSETVLFAYIVITAANVCLVPWGVACGCNNPTP